MKMTYKTVNPRRKTMELIEQAVYIIDEYQQQGFELTVRQIYYQFVSRGLIENTPKSYLLIGRILNAGRMGGMIDWNAIVDRTRSVYENSHWSNPGDILDSAACSYRLDSRKGQHYYVEVWIEKDALIGVIQNVCKRLDVLYLPCKGYYSLSAMWRAAQRIRSATGRLKNDSQAVVLHLGDHDPSGLDMTRDISDRLTTFGCDVSVRRIALTMEQVEEVQPPPNFAKPTDSRYADYRSEFGDESWELDALSPTYIENLIEKHVNKLTDIPMRKRQLKLEQQHREKLEYIAENWESI